MSSRLNLIYVSSLGLTITDGTVAGTRVVTGTSGSFVQVTDLVSWGDDVCFVAASSLGCNELWETDGTTEGDSVSIGRRRVSPGFGADLSGGKGTIRA